MYSADNNVSRTLVSEEYRLLNESAAVMELPCGALSLKGRDAFDFLQRLSTNDVLHIANGNAGMTILVNEKAKIIDIVTVLHVGDEIILVLESREAVKMEQWLNRFLFTEDVLINNISAEYLHRLVIGKEGGKRIQELLNITMPEERTNSSGFMLQVSGGFVFQDFLWQLPAYHLFLKKNESDRIIEHLVAELGMLSFTSEAIEAFRVEHGVPKFGAELTEQVNPLEAGLERFISWTKGCYIGQEIIARIDTYKKLQRKLTGFVFDSDQAGSSATADTKNSLPNDLKLFVGSDEVGWMTSQAWSPKLQRHIAFGYLKTNVESEVIEFRNDRSGAALIARISNFR